ncbi:hypothetical protein D1007_50640 [Hordeum vulgare]|nr:hypothetical protein D1007_50640 [Hordeum vulgare]
MMEEALGKLDISEEEATPLVIDDSEGGSQPKWLLAGRVMCCNLLHIQMIQSALRPAWGNHRELLFRSLGENTFAAEFESKRDRDRVWDGSPWHINKHAVILQNLEEHMQPSELVFESLPVWVRVVNLPYNLRNNKWGLAIARQIDKTASIVQIDLVGGFLRARVSIDVRKPLRRWILIESAKRRSTDKYEIEYEHIPHFCFSCGRLGHAYPFCPSPGTRDENGDLLFKPSLRAAEDRRRTSSGEHQPKPSNQNNTSESRASSTKQKEGVEVTSPVKAPVQQKRKGVPQATHTYRPVVKPLVALTEHGDAMVCGTHEIPQIMPAKIGQEKGTMENLERDMKKKRPTPPSSESSAAVAGCFAVSSSGLSGGIGLFWKADFDVDLVTYSAGHIDVRVRRKEQ